MIEIIKMDIPFKGTPPKLCASCIHKCVFKDIILCNIDTNPILFYHNNDIKPITHCKDYVFAEDAYPKINIHSIWDWCSGFVIPTPVIVCCKHEIPEFEQPSIDELRIHCRDIAKGYNIKLKGFPWIINIGEISEKYGVKLYRTNLLSSEEVNNILNNIKR